MKKIIKKFWGVAFVLVMLSTLFVAAIPQASAGTQDFTKATLPNDAGVSGGITANNTNIYDFVVANDNLTIYAATSNSGLKSIDGGRHWTNLTAIKIAGTTYVAVAGDDPKYVAFLDQTSMNVTLSKDGGATFMALVFPPERSPILLSRKPLTYKSAISNTEQAMFLRFPARTTPTPHPPFTTAYLTSSVFQADGKMPLATIMPINQFRVKAWSPLIRPSSIP
jgi:hypothetical protein